MRNNQTFNTFELMLEHVTKRNFIFALLIVLVLLIANIMISNPSKNEDKIIEINGIPVSNVKKINQLRKGFIVNTKEELNTPWILEYKYKKPTGEIYTKKLPAPLQLKQN